ncbi:MAG TPA: chemotaxis protein CheX [Nitrosopumilaceae archaeon]|nr:chemotaxis protein CheX [Nitrosopumilaceae archaeon]
MDDKSNLKQNEVEIFTKVINEYIALQTSSSLSTLLSEAINYNVMILDKRFFNPNNIKLSSDEIQMCGVRLRGKGDIHIEICYAIKMKYAKQIAAKLLGKDEIQEIDEMGTSAIQEVANILTGSFFNAMAIGTGFRVDLSTPDYLQSDLESLVKKSAQDVINTTDSAIIADAELIGKESGIRIHMIIVQNSNDARKIINQNGKKKPSELSSLNDTESYITGGKNSELDDLLKEIEKEAN